MSASTRSLLDELSELVGEKDVVTDPSVRAAYERDITGRFTGTALAVVRPRDARRCAEVVTACAQRSHPVVVRGGGTGLVGGAVPTSPEEVVLSLERLDDIADAGDGTADLVVGAGARLQAVQDSARGRGMEFPLDFGARSAATIGGMIATNAAGPLALRYGPMRAQLAGLEAVLADGRTLTRLSGLKDTAGYDWTALIVGSEGTLAVITRARLRLVHPPARRAAALFGVARVEDMLALLGELRMHLGEGLEAADFFTDAGMELVCSHRRLSPPLRRRHGWYLIAQAAGAGDPVTAIAAAVGPREDDVAVADDTAGRRDLWAFRDWLNEAIGADGVPHKLDVSIPHAKIPAFLADVDAVLAALDDRAQVVHYGHLGDGNLHVNVLGLDPHDERVDDAVLNLVARYGGSISAEHGIGIAKRHWLHLTRTAAELSAMRALKDALDPHGVLGRGRVLPPSGP